MHILPILGAIGCNISLEYVLYMEDYCPYMEEDCVFFRRYYQFCYISVVLDVSRTSWVNPKKSKKKWMILVHHIKKSKKRQVGSVRP